MSERELSIAGIGISKEVIAAIVTRSAERVEGVARVGDNDVASSLVNVFTRRKSSEPSVDSFIENGKLRVGVHLAVFYGYPFTALAADVREAVSNGISSQIGVDVAAVDVSIDSLVFPKE